MNKFAFFDFDDTLLPKDSMGRLVKYCIKKHPTSCIYLFPLAFYGILYFLKLCKIKAAKERLLFPLKVLNEDELKDFYTTCLIPNYYPNVVDELKQKKEAGYLIYLVSASPEQYLKYTDLPVDMIIGTVVKNTNGKIEMVGNNCKGKEKVVRINHILSQKGLSIDYDHSYGYSDSTSDLPMLELVKNRIRISKKDGSMSSF